MRTEQAKVRRRAQSSEAPVQVPGPDLRQEGWAELGHEDRVVGRAAPVRPVRSASLQLPPDPSPSLSPEIHFGILLRRARERRGLSLQDVVRVTRISERWLPALEEARLDLLPAPVFVAGYVRSYARVVGLDEGDLLDRYHALVQQRMAQGVIPSEPDLSGPLAERAAQRRKLVAAGCTTLLLLVLTMVWILLRR